MDEFFETAETLDLYNLEEAALFEEKTVSIRPQQGPQEAFLSSAADIAIYGGAAGGGKTFGLLMEPLRHINNSDYGMVIFRKTSVQVRNEGGLWDESLKIYPFQGGRGSESILNWRFPSGMAVKFSHLEYDKNVLNWQGSQIPTLGFDELTHFTEYQFFYMLSRNRSTSGVPGYVRCTTNPDKNSWVRKFIDWWIGPDGFPIKERGGVLRWFIRQDDKIIWADTRNELVKTYGKDTMPKSVTFIPSSIEDNKILLQKDPSYKANLLALPRVERLRLLGGNWDVTKSAGNYFKKEWFRLVDTIPSGHSGAVRYWDRAATRPNEENPDPDWTRGLKMLKYPDGTCLVTDLRSLRDSPNQIERLVLNTAHHDGFGVTVWGEQEPGSAGVADAQNFAKLLNGFNVRIARPTKDKTTRALPVSAQSEAGNIMVLKAPWNDEFFQELEDFPEGGHDDIVDTLSGAYNELNQNASIFTNL